MAAMAYWHGRWCRLQHASVSALQCNAMHGWNLLQATCRFNTLAGTQPPYCASDGATLMKASLGVADVYACDGPTENGVSLQLEELLVLIGVVRSVQTWDTVVVFSFTRHISSAIVVYKYFLG
jgi:hypothetical protein